MDTLFFIAVIPVIVLAIYFYNKDVDKEPKKVLLKIFFIEIALTIAVAFVETSLSKKVLVNDELSFLFYYVYIVGFAEEFSKFLPAYFFGIRSEHYNSYYDAVIYCVFSALGFACIENIMYVMSGGIFVGILRAVLSVPGHILWSAIVGAFIGLATITEKKRRKQLKPVYVLTGLITASFIHGIFDYSLESGNFIAILFIFVVEIILAIFTVSMIKKVGKINSFKIERKVYLKHVISIIVLALVELVTVMYIINVTGNSFSYYDGKTNLNELLEIDEAKIMVNTVEYLENNQESDLENNKYLKVNVTIENNGNEVFQTKGLSKFVIKEREGSNEITPVSLVIDNELPQTINPNESKTGDMYFKIKEIGKYRLIYEKCNSVSSCNNYIVNLEN